ncbi:DedA family protein [Afipia clevelandensis]|uniref:VTT domain-containing protein n=1 Tax=Afipia clevelandensis ATCC 49720 TaxID=883079 RepID=K8NWW0_9BRAD|nr:DedA family protein [Afipia clevelandensis]EKS33661.1 hypothetical protein HMPREF9696_02781 [Afipia clevelandensis ATCC 49720]
MASYFQQLIGFVSLHAALAYAAIFLAAFLEAVPILGSLIPGSTLIIALGALIPSGSLGFIPVLGLAVVGALLGDGIAYWIGHVSQRKVLTSWPMVNYRQLVARSEDFFRRYGTLAVFLARFVPPVRAVIPITAGALGMPPHRFYPVNAAAVLIWAALHVLSGALAGSAAERWGMKIEHYGVPLVVGIAAVGCLAVAAQYWRQRRKTAADSSR